MATVVGILDQDSWSARTDNIVVADPVAKSLTWIPRDLWCAVLGDRINEAFALAGIPGSCMDFANLGSVAIRVWCYGEAQPNVQ